MINQTVELPYVEDVFEGFCNRLLEMGLPLERATLHLRTLHPQFLGGRFLWLKETKKVDLAVIGREALTIDAFRNSPVRALYEGAEGIRQRLDVPPQEDEFGVYQDLRNEGLTDYVALPLITVSGQRHASSWSTGQKGGFSTEHLSIISELLPVLSMAAEIRLNRRIAKNLLNTYVGSYAGNRVLDGDIERGQGETIRAAIWICDLRDFTSLSERNTQAQVIQTLDDYFEVMGAAVVKHGGEILKFIGDAMLAIFPTDQISNPACVAIDAALEAVEAMDKLNERRHGDELEALDYGIGLHVGDVIYGNIGTMDRLDFTVIGPAVNMTARLEHLCRSLGPKVLVSAAFAEACSRPLTSMGFHGLRGISQAVEVFAPPSIIP
ncbi:MAG: adenylate/guanylate cyclase domain-containing protein [Geminicoccaceae bacterium]